MFPTWCKTKISAGQSNDSIDNLTIRKEKIKIRGKERERDRQTDRQTDRQKQWETQRGE